LNDIDVNFIQKFLKLMVILEFSMINIEEFHWLTPDHLPGTEVLCGRHNTTPMSSFHERYALTRVIGGVATFHYRGRSELIFNGHIGLMEPGETYVTTSIHMPGNWDVLFLSTDVFQRAAEEMGFTREVHFRPGTAQVDDPHLFTAARKFFASLQADAPMLEQESLLALCLHQMFSYAEWAAPPSTGAHGHKAVEQAKAYLLEHYLDPVSLEELSEMAGLGRFSLLRNFAREVGMPPHAFQIHVRIERARALLEAGGSPLCVALQTGFTDQSHFTRHFQKILHVTPGQYARCSRRTVSFP
jgi:AraC-like DNA-binding protein